MGAGAAMQVMRSSWISNRCEQLSSQTWLMGRVWGLRGGVEDDPEVFGLSQNGKEWGAAGAFCFILFWFGFVGGGRCRQRNRVLN